MQRNCRVLQGVHSLLKRANLHHSPPKTTNRLLTSAAACPLRAVGCCLLVICSLLQVNSCKSAEDVGSCKVKHAGLVPKT